MGTHDWKDKQRNQSQIEVDTSKKKNQTIVPSRLPISFNLILSFKEKWKNKM